MCEVENDRRLRELKDHDSARRTAGNANVMHVDVEAFQGQNREVIGRKVHLIARLDGQASTRAELDATSHRAEVAPADNAGLRCQRVIHRLDEFHRVTQERILRNPADDLCDQIAASRSRQTLHRRSPSTAMDVPPSVREAVALHESGHANKVGERQRRKCRVTTRRRELRAGRKGTLESHDASVGARSIA